jgi:hypothetical protein
LEDSGLALLITHDVVPPAIPWSKQNGLIMLFSVFGFLLKRRQLSIS